VTPHGESEAILSPELLPIIRLKAHRTLAKLGIETMKQWG